MIPFASDQPAANDPGLTLTVQSINILVPVAVVALGVSLTALYIWWIAVLARGFRDERNPRALSGRERAAADPQVVSVLDRISGSRDQGRLSDALVREPRRRWRSRVTFPVLAAVLVGSATFLLLVGTLDPASAWFVSLLMYGSAASALLTLALGAVAAVSYYKRRDRKQPLAAAAVAVARMLATTRDRARSEFEVAYGRVETGSEVRAAFLEAKIPIGDLELLHLVAPQNDGAWERARTFSLQQVARAFQGEFLRSTDRPAEATTRWWERLSAAISAVVLVSGLAVKLIDLLGI